MTNVLTRDFFHSGRAMIGDDATCYWREVGGLGRRVIVTSWWSGAETFVPRDLLMISVVVVGGRWRGLKGRINY